MSDVLLQVQDLTIAYRRAGLLVPVTDEVSFSVDKGEVFALVGESGCGKTATALAVARLLPVPSSQIMNGKILLQGKDWAQARAGDLCAIRARQVGVVFQEPSLALDPVRTVGSQLRECLGATEARIHDLLKEVGLPDPHRVLSAYGHQLSGGMAQRVCIAMALLPEPALVIADEPTTALDVTVQAAVMETLRQLIARRGASLLLISHNLHLVGQYAQKLGVMYAGRIVESGPVADVLSRPMHPYTQALLRALPGPGRKLADLVPISGQVPRPEDYIQGCRFADRCEKALKECCTQRPVSQGTGHKVACLMAEVSP